MRRLGGQAVRLLRGLLFALTLALVLPIALAWRLSAGPLELPWVARLVEAAASSEEMRLAVERAELSWAGWTSARSSPLEIRLLGLIARDAAGEVRAALPQARLMFSWRSLLAGQVAPVALVFEGLSLSLRRTEEGRITLDLGDRGAGTGAGEEPSGAAVLAPEGPLRALARVVLRRSSLAFADEASGLQAEITDLFLDLRRRQGLPVAAEGQGVLRLAGAEQTVRFRLDEAEEEGYRLRVEAGVLSPALLDAALPEAAGLPRLAAPVGLVLAAEVARDGRFHSLRLTARIGQGRLLPPSGQAIGVEVGTADLRLDADGVPTGRAMLVLAPADPTTPPVRIEAALRPQAAGLVLEAEADRLPLPLLLDLWPEAAAPGGRRWVAAQITEATAREARLRLAFRQAEGWAVPELLSLSGEARIEGATVHWLPPIPPAEDAAGRIRFAGAEVVIELAGGRQQGAALRVTGGRLRFSDLDQAEADHWADLSLDLAGEVPALLALLGHPRLGLLDRRPLPVAGAGGRVFGRLAMRFPLRADLTLEELVLDATAQVSDLTLPGALLGERLERGAFTLQADTAGLRFEGTARLLDTQARIQGEFDFAAGGPAQVVERLRAEGRVPAAALLRVVPGLAVLNPGGQAEVTAVFERRRNGRAEAEITADLARSTLAVPALAWRKPAGRPGRAAMLLRLQGERLLAAERLVLTAADLRLAGRMDFAAGGRLAAIEIAEAALHEGRFSGRILAPERSGAPWRIRLQGPLFDLAPLLETPAEAAATSGAEGPPLLLEAQFERLRLGPERLLHGVEGRLQLDSAGAIREAAVNGRTAPAEGAFSARILPRAGGREVTVEAADGGALLRVLGLSQVIEGGRLALTGRWQGEGRGRVLSGQAVLEGFAVRDAPAIGKFLQAITVIGILEAARSPHLTFERAVVPFTLSPETLVIGEARAYSPSLGLTATGRVDRRRETLDLSGTVVPAYLLNTLPGRLPLIGRLFSPEYGGGVLAIAWRARGPAADPEVSVNPLSALTPGFLRGLFGSAPAEPPPPSPR